MRRGAPGAALAAAFCVAVAAGAGSGAGADQGEEPPAEPKAHGAGAGAGERKATPLMRHEAREDPEPRAGLAAVRAHPRDAVGQLAALSSDPGIAQDDEGAGAAVRAHPHVAASKIAALINGASLGFDDDHDYHDYHDYDDYSACTDMASWTDSFGDSCSVYSEKKLCNGHGGPGPGWSSLQDGGKRITDGVSATKACCACGKDTPAPQGQGPCTDRALWTDSRDRTCHEYSEDNLCDGHGGIGFGWSDRTATFSQYARDGVDATQACCACGKAATTPAPHSDDYYADYDDYDADAPMPVTDAPMPVTDAPMPVTDTTAQSTTTTTQRTTPAPTQHPATQAPVRALTPAPVPALTPAPRPPQSRPAVPRSPALAHRAQEQLNASGCKYGGYGMLDKAASGKRAKCADTKREMLNRLEHRHGKCQYMQNGTLDKSLSAKKCEPKEEDAKSAATAAALPGFALAAALVVARAAASGLAAL